MAHLYLTVPNVLLNLYRYTPRTRDRLFVVLEGLADRVRLTHQAAFEFHRNRLDVIAQQRNAYDQIADAIVKRNFQDSLTQIRQQHSRHSAIDIGPLEAIVNDAQTKLTAVLTEAKGQHPDFTAQDDILDRLTALFDGRVGDPYTKDDRGKKYKEAQDRLDRKIPPGYEDAKKPEPDRYGDALVWFQLLQHAQEQKKPVIFVTDDKKDDWWRRHSGQTIGPRPELVQEMRDTAGVAFYMYPPERFMEYAVQFLGLPEQRDAIEEVEELGQQDEALQFGVDPDTARANWLENRSFYSWTEFWHWVRQYGFMDRKSLDAALGHSTDSMTPREIREALKAQYGDPLLNHLDRWHRDEPDFSWADLLRVLQYESSAYKSIAELAADLERILGRSIAGMTPAQVRDQLILVHGYFPA